MFLCRFLYNDLNPKYGLIDDCKIFILNSSFNIELDYIYYKDFITDEVNISDVQFIPPCLPSKIVGIALNYPGVGEIKSGLDEPLAFIKGLNTLVLDDFVLDLPPHIMAWGECELAVVIKRQAKNVNYGDTSDYILGYLPANDITSENYNGRDHHLARSKSADGFCPVGRYIDLDYKYRNKTIKGFQNNILTN